MCGRSPRPSSDVMSTYMSRSFDQLIGCNEKRLWHRKAKRLCSLRVDDKLEFRWPPNRKIVWLGTAQNLAGIDAELVIGIGETSAVAHQPAIGWVLPNMEDARQSMTG